MDKKEEEVEMEKREEEMDAKMEKEMKEDVDEVEDDEEEEDEEEDKDDDEGKTLYDVTYRLADFADRLLEKYGRPISNTAAKNATFVDEDKNCDQNM